MRLIKQSIERDGSGFVTLYPEDPEDMWSTYNLLLPGDSLRASALRRITTESSTGSTSSQRIHLTLTIRVQSTHFDTQASTLHVSGPIITETPHAKLGQYHTLDLALCRNFTITKEAEIGSRSVSGSGGGGGGGVGGGWDSVSREIVREACSSRRGITAWVLLMQEGLAHIACLLGERTVVRQRISIGIPGKKSEGKIRDKAVEKFFHQVLEALIRAIGPEEMAGSEVPILVASPGYTAAKFKDYVSSEAVRRGDKGLMTQRKSLVVVHSSSGQMGALSEVLKDPSVQSRLKDTRYAREGVLVELFFDMLRKDDGRAWYGHKEVERAVERGAVGRGGGVLLISNGLFRSLDLGVRKRWVRLVDRVREVEGGEVRVLSSEHESGKRIEGLGGVAALCTFPVEGLDEEEDEDEDEEV